MNIFCGSLPWSLEESELRGYFEEYGEVSSARIITDRATGRSKGFGFVEMSDDSAAEEAIEQLNGSEMKGREVVINQAEDRKRNDRRGGGNFRSGGGGYGRDNDGRRGSGY
ncbi:MAG: RNA-binding protein [Owenweeksia sp.]|nr:RNA-binding protein [Owenweeksia sp.]